MDKDLTDEEKEIMKYRICHICKGTFFVERTIFVDNGKVRSQKEVCPKCEGSGFEDWISDIKNSDLSQRGNL